MTQRALPTVLHVAPVGMKKASGFSTSVPGMVGSLHDLGVRTGLLTTSPQGPYTGSQPYPVVYYRDLARLSALAAMPPPLDRPDLLVFHSTYIPTHAFLARYARRRDIPYVIVPRGGMTQGAQRSKRLKKAAGNLLFFDNLVRHAAAIHCLTEREAGDVKAWGRPIFVLGNGIDLPPADRLARPGAKRGLRVVFVGRLALQHKGLDLLLQACALARDDLGDAGARVRIYGPGISGDKKELERMIVDYELQSLVECCGPVYNAEKDRVLQSADAFVHTSRFEGHPMAVLEALAHGLPCLLTPGTNLAREVVEAGAGWEAAADAESIASALRQVVKEDSVLLKMGSAARKLAEKRYGWKQVGKQLLERYQEIVDA